MNTAASIAEAADSAIVARRLRARQILVVSLLFVGYGAYYFCRSDLSVAMPMLVDELRRSGMSADDALVRLGGIASLGVLAYAFGKFFLTGLGDLWGGKRSFTLGLGGAVVFTLLFAAGGALPIFAAAWIANRLTQSIGWAGAVKVCSKWFSYSAYGTVMGVLSVSYLIGDAAARESMAWLIARGAGWRTLFVFAAVVGACALIANLLFLRESRVELGHDEAQASPVSVFAGASPPTRGWWAVVRPLLASRAFVVVCLLSLGATMVRETFNTWTPEYLRGFFGYSAADAAARSAIFPLVGATSVVIMGCLSDLLGASGRALLMVLGLATTAIALGALASIQHASTTVVPLTLVGIVAFSLLGPYSYLAGAVALDFGGKAAAATSSGLIDGVGYLGGALAGVGVARVAIASGWRGVFAALAVVSCLSATAAGYLLFDQRRAERGQQMARF